MKVVDANALIRLIANDIPEQAQIVLDVLASGTWHVGQAVLSEVCFVLEFHDIYRYPRETVKRALLAILSQPTISTDTTTYAALDLYGKHPKLDFVDCLLVIQSAGKKRDVLTFDKRLLKTLS